MHNLFAQNVSSNYITANSSNEEVPKLCSPTRRCCCNRKGRKKCSKSLLQDWSGCKFFCSVASVKVRQHSPSFARDRRLTNCDHLLGVNPGHGESWHSYHILLVEQKLPYHSELLPLPPTHPQPRRDECPCSYTVQATLQVGHYRAGTLGGATVKCGTVLPPPMSSSMQRTPGMDLICVPLRGWGWGGG